MPFSIARSAIALPIAAAAAELPVPFRLLASSVSTVEADANTSEPLGAIN